ncbi:MAG: hypothetical protein PHF20_00825 [Halothiobacillaceae bacterium]|nr:hypothetical protein [Halothiobacillaceae bacterium]
MNFATRFKHSVLALACAGVMATLVGCGGDDATVTQTTDPTPAPVNPSPTQASSQISGTAMAGRFLSGEVCAYKLAAGKQGDKLACAKFDANSQFTIDVGTYVGEVLLSIEGGATYDDEATQGDESNGTPLKGSMRSIVAVKGGKFTAAMTPFTELAVRMASPMSLVATQEKAKILLGLLPLESSFDLLNTLPSLDNKDVQPMLYREILRGLSQMQTDAKMQGDLGSYLSTLVDAISNGSDADKEKLKEQIVAAISKGLDSSYCALKDTRLTCQTTPQQPGAALTCKTELFQAGTVVSLPGSMDIVSFSGPYSGDEGLYDDNFNFTKTGDAQLLFGTDAKVIYNGVEYPLNSLCMETNATYGKMFYLHFAGNQAHIDLFSDRSWSGVSPKDGVTAVKGAKPASNPPGGGTQPGTGSSDVSFSTSINGFTGIQGVAPVFKQSKTSTDLDRREWKWTVGSDMNQLSLVVVHTQGQSKDSDMLEIAVGGGLPHFSAKVNDIIGMCTLGWVSSSPQVKECSTLGVSFDKTTGSIGFNKTPMATIIGTPAKFTLGGSAGFTPF